MTYVTSFERVGEKRGIKIGEKRGEKRNTLRIVNKMLKRGDSVEEIVEVTDVTREEILYIKKEMDV